MTSGANDEWDYGKLETGIKYLELSLRHLLHNEKAAHDVEAVKHTLEFIEYNMRELEVTGGNGD